MKHNPFQAATVINVNEHFTNYPESYLYSKLISKGKQNIDSSTISNNDWKTKKSHMTLTAIRNMLFSSELRCKLHTCSHTDGGKCTVF